MSLSSQISAEMDKVDAEAASPDQPETSPELAPDKPEKQESEPGGETPQEDQTQKSEDSAQKAAPIEKKAEEKKHKVTIDGRELEVGEDELKRGYQLSGASYKRLEEAKRLANDARGVIELIGKDPKAAVLQVLAGVHKSPETALKAFQKMAIDTVAEMLKEEEMSPEERHLNARRRDLEAKEKELTARDEAARARVLAQMEKQHEALLEKEISAALKDTGLKESPTVLRRIEQYLIFASENDLPMTAAEAVRIVKGERDQLLSEIRTEESAKPGPKLLKKAESSEFVSTAPGDGTEPEKKTPRNKTFGTLHEFHRDVAARAGV